MYRPALRAASGVRALPIAFSARRTLSTAPPHKLSRSWKSSFARWGLAGALVYYYNTSSIFADEPASSIHSPPEATRQNETFQTLDAVAEQRKAAQSRARAREVTPDPPASTTTAATATPDTTDAQSPEDLEAEAGQQGAFNEETGEINWDCPCLGGMAHGPCGDQFKAAFSCFVFSKDEPKGVDCIEHFKTMQDCFRDHPEMYGSELEDDEVEGQLEGHGEARPAPAQPSEQHGEKVAAPRNEDHVVAEKKERAEAAKKQVDRDHGAVSDAEQVVPKAAHDAR